MGPALDALVARCLEKSAEARPSMEEVARELARPSLLAGGRSSRVSRLQRGSLLLLLLAGVAAVGVLSMRFVRGGVTPPSQAGSAVAAASVIPTAVTDLPLPASTVEGALATYRSALAHEREGAEDATLEELERAVKQDPDLAAAHLRLALRIAYTESQRAHVHFANAVKNRGRLSPRDQEVLEAAQPLFERDPADSDAWDRGLGALATKWPGDAELAYEVAATQRNLGDFAAAVASDSRAVALDPKFGLARAGLAEDQAYLGQFDAARATVARCLEASPNATWCMWITEYVNSEQGVCTDASARARIAIDPSLWNSYLELYYALTAKGEDSGGAREAVTQVVQRIPDPYRSRRLDLNLTIRLDELRGDFVSAMTHADQLRTHVAKSSETPNRAVAAILSSEIAVETGRLAQSGTFAKEYLDRHDVWQSAPIVTDYSLADDSVPIIVSLAYHAGAIPKSELVRVLTTWRAKWEPLLRGDYRRFLWVYGYAGVVDTRDEAVSAVAELPRYSPIPPFVPNGWLPLATVGRTLWLAGHEDEGIAYLTHAAHSCNAGVHPIPWIRAHGWLAEALAKRGDTDGACRENDVVLQRWGDAKPRSVTADAARARARALGCKVATAR